MARALEKEGLGELAPERLEVPSGSRVRIDYPDVADDGGRPVVAVKLQECFGWAQTPRWWRGGWRGGCRCCSTCCHRQGGRWP